MATGPEQHDRDRRFEADAAESRDSRAASLLAERLINNAQEVLPEWLGGKRDRRYYYDDTANSSEADLSRRPLHIADVEHAVERFTLQAFLFDGYRYPMPALRTNNGPIPIDVDLPYPFASPNQLERPPYRYFSPEYLSATVGQPDDERITSISTEEARTSFRQRLVAFLGIRRRNTIAPPSAPGYAFQVSTSTPDLRVYYSPCFFINRNQVFGSPTTPVTGWVHPGRYVFFTNSPQHWDEAEYDIPGPNYATRLYV